MNNRDTRQPNDHQIKIELLGFATFSPVLKNNDSMALLRVGVQVDLLKRDYYDIRLFGPQARYAAKAISKGSILKIEGYLDVTVRKGKKGLVNPRLNVTTKDFSFGNRGDAHYARAEAVGELGTNPYQSRTMNGTEVSSFQLKVIRTWKGKKRTDILDVCVFGGTATAANAYLYRGRDINVRGDLRLSRFKGRDGKQKVSVDLQAKKVTFFNEKAAGEADRADAA